MLAAAGLVYLRHRGRHDAEVDARPLKESDYLVIGSVATLVALAVMFVVLISTSMQAKDVFFRRRKK